MARGAAPLARAATRVRPPTTMPPGDQLDFAHQLDQLNQRHHRRRRALRNHTQHKAMLRRDPTRIEMKPEDIEEFDAYVAQQKASKKDDKGEKPTKKEERDARIGYRPTMSDSPGY